MNTYKLNRTNRKHNFKIEATCIEDNGAFIVKAGSIISPYELTGLSKRMKQIRSNAPISEDKILLEDVILDSLYDAACFVIGTNASGDWFKLVEYLTIFYDIKTTYHIKIRSILLLRVITIYTSYSIVQYDHHKK